MKYTIYINQAGIYKQGLTDKTNLSDWAILDYIASWYATEQKRTIVGPEGRNYVWINYNHMLGEMPLLGFKTKQQLVTRIKRLRKLGLVLSIKQPNGDLFICLTNLATQSMFWTEPNGYEDFYRKRLQERVALKEKQKQANLTP